MPDFCHLHCHTQFSLLDGAAGIGDMMDKAAADGMKAVALTDHGNMFGAFKFVSEAQKRGLKPIVGCEFYLVENRHQKEFKRGAKDNRYHQLLLAKNKQGYENISKLCSLGFIEGLYSKYPRIDKELLLQYHEGLVATSCCIGAEIPQAILHGELDKAEELLRWWIDVFGKEDYYIELQRHRGLEDIDGLGVSQEDINQQLLRLAKKYELKVIATNDSHYVNEEDWLSHDILLCINTGQKLEEEDRFKFPSSDFFFKTQEQMGKLFADVPQALDFTIEIADKVQELKLSRDVLLPAFPLPDGFATQDDYLRYLTFEGAKRRYGEITAQIEERLNFELNVIKNSGYPGYFLIVQDFTTAARQMGVSVGPGRGSAAGSAVAYCIGITNVDPIKYDLLFERFLNPERVSMPDIDIDFDDEGREKVINYVIDKYGRNQVAQIITYGSMAAKSSLRDVGRVMNIPLPEVDVVAKTFPTHLKATLKKVLAKDDIDPKLKEELNSDEKEQAYNFRKMAEKGDDIAKMIKTATKLEGSIRNTGIHACGIVITPDDITRYVPVTTAKDSELLVSQFDNSVAENAGLLKMDFLGLKTLTIIKDALAMIKENHGVDIDIDAIPLDDKKTYELFQRGETVAIFQYESSGMQKYMRELIPTNFADLIAMNALYRPGPLDYIPSFVARKNGKEPIKYDLPDMEEYLAETYGITVYQEQVMLLSQKLANFTKGQADALRKAMGKKQIKILNELFPKFLEGCLANGHPKEICEKIWKDWEAFASYAFNKSHSTCYAFVAYQTAYLKAHYPAEYMASVLSHNKGNMEDVTFFLQESRTMGINVLGPDVNESGMNFTVNKQGQIRFGLSALKGVGEGPVEDIIRARKEGGAFASVFDFVRRINLRVANKKCIESLVLSGALDCMGINRAQYYTLTDDKQTLFLEMLMRYGSNYQKQQDDMTVSLFGGAAVSETMPEPKIPNAQEWGLLDKLEKEQEVTGFFLSGHPLDNYRAEMQRFTKPLTQLDDYKDRDVNVGGIISGSQHRTSANGKPYGRFTLADYVSKIEIMLFGEDYLKFKHLLDDGTVVFIKAKYSESWRDKGKYELRINDMQLMDSINQKMVKGITISLPIEWLTEELLDKMEALFQQYPGEQSLAIQLIDKAEKLQLSLLSQNLKVSADSTLILALERIGLICQLV